MKKAFNIFKTKFPAIFILSLMIILPVYLIQEFLLVPFTPEISAEDAAAYSMDTKMIWYLMGALIISLFTELHKVTIIKLTFESLESRDISVTEIMDFSMRLWPKTLVTTLLYALFVAFGFMLFFIPGMMMFVLYYFYIQVVVLYGIWGRGALGVSSLYAKKMLNKTITIVLVGFVLQYGISLGVSLLQNVIPNQIASQVTAVAVFFVGQFIISFIDIFATVCVHDTDLGIDVNVFKKKKDQNVQH